ncbi:unnamed protein product [Ectocarpus sp. 4 AP-2014]
MRLGCFICVMRGFTGLVQGDRALYMRSGTGTTIAVVAFFFLHLHGWWCCMVVRAKGRLGCVIFIPTTFIFGGLTSPSDRQVTIRETPCLCVERSMVVSPFFFLLDAVPAWCFPSLSHGRVCHPFFIFQVRLGVFGFQRQHSCA